MFNPFHIAGDDKFNEAWDKLQQQRTDERHHQEMLQEQRIANEISRKALQEAEKANRKSKQSNIIAIVSVVISSISVAAAILIGVFC